MINLWVLLRPQAFSMTSRPSKALLSLTIKQRSPLKIGRYKKTVINTERYYC